MDDLLICVDIKLILQLQPKLADAAFVGDSGELRNWGSNWTQTNNKQDGASCTVRKAVRRDTSQVFAIKFYQNQLLKAKNQIQILIRLDHPSIVNIYEIIEEGDIIYLVLEYMAGGQLYDSVGQKQKFTQNQVREYMKSIVDAVRYCHQMNIVHRDIKNLLLTTRGPDGVLKLADFGISKIMSDQNLNTNCGTPVYMAPEIWKGEQYNTKVDVWSMGVVMYYLLSGQHPFWGDDEQKLSTDVRQGQLQFPEQLWNVISSKAIDLLRSLLAKDPNERPTANVVLNHIWLTHVDQILPGMKPPQEIILSIAVMKIRRYIHKQKQKVENHIQVENYIKTEMLSQENVNQKKNFSWYCRQIGAFNIKFINVN